MSDMLDTLINENEKFKKLIEDEARMKTCIECGKMMIDNSFMHGSRKAGSYDCSCGFKLTF